MDGTDSVLFDFDYWMPEAEMKYVERDYMTRVRNTDPVESVLGAVAPDVEGDRLKLVKVYKAFPRTALTHRQAAEFAAVAEGNESIERVESLRRRGSDLVQRGIIVQVGRENRQATFRLAS